MAGNSNEGVILRPVPEMRGVDPRPPAANDAAADPLVSGPFEEALILRREPVPQGAPYVVSRSVSRQDRAPRQGWVDNARGLAMILVVVGHVLGGLIDAQLVGAGSVLRTSFFAIYTFHMPVFLFLSALFTQGRIARSRHNFGLSLAQDVVWPYVLWSVALVVAANLAPGGLNHAPPSLMAGIAQIPTRPVGPFWFLYSLFLLQAGALLAERLRAEAAYPWVLLALSAAARVWGGANILTITASMGIWYALGYAMGPAMLGALARPRRALDAPTVAAAVLVMTAGRGVSIFAVMRVLGQIADSPAPEVAAIAWRATFVGFAALGVVAAFAAGWALRGRLAHWVGVIGRRSMPIYVMHVTIVAATRIFLRRAGILNPYEILSLATLLGLVLPIMVFAAAQRFGVNRLLGLGRAA